MLRAVVVAALCGALAFGASLAIAAPTGPTASTAYRVSVVTLTAQPAIVRRASARPAELATTLQSAILSLIAHATTSGLDLAGPPYVRYLARGEAGGVYDVEVGLPVIKAPAAEPGAAIQPGTLPAGDAATLLHVGPHVRLPDAHAALARWLAASGRRAAGPAWEVYLTNPITTPDPAKQRTKIFLPLAPRSPR